MSEVHARVARGRVTDLDSRNGTIVRGRRVRVTARLSAGDVLRIGDSVIAVREQWADVVTAKGRARSQWGLASGGAASLSMVVFAVASGHLVLAGAILAVPLALGLAALARSRTAEPTAGLDVTGTLGVPDLPDGPIAVSGPRGLVRAVTLATGRPAASARQFEAWMATLPPARARGDVASQRRGAAVDGPGPHHRGGSGHAN